MRKIVGAVIPVGLMTILTLFCPLAHGDQSLALINAAKHGDLKQVQELLDKGADVNAKTRMELPH